MHEDEVTARQTNPHHEPVLQHEKERFGRPQPRGWPPRSPARRGSGCFAVGTQGSQEPGGLRLLGGLLLVVSMVLALCAWAANGRRQQLPSAGESTLGEHLVGTSDRHSRGVVEPGATPGDAPAADRWQILPWVPLIVVALSVAAYVMLDQISVGMSAAARDKMRLPPVLLCGLAWPVAASTAVICLIGTVRKAEGELHETSRRRWLPPYSAVCRSPYGSWP